MNKITIFENAYLRIFQYAIFGYSFYKFPKFYFLYLENMKLAIFKIAILSIDKIAEMGYTDNDRLLSIENSILKI